MSVVIAVAVVNFAAGALIAGKLAAAHQRELWASTITALVKLGYLDKSAFGTRDEVRIAKLADELADPWWRHLLPPRG